MIEGEHTENFTPLDPEAEARVALNRLHDVFHLDHMIALKQYQDEVGLMRTLRQPFTPDFLEAYGDTLDLLTTTYDMYDDEIEDRMENDEMLQELVAIRQRHERRRGDDNARIEPEEVSVAFWTRRNMLAYLESLAVTDEAASTEYPVQESTQQAS